MTAQLDAPAGPCDGSDHHLAQILVHYSFTLWLILLCISNGCELQLIVWIFHSAVQIHPTHNQYLLLCLLWLPAVIHLILATSILAAWNSDDD